MDIELYNRSIEKDSPSVTVLASGTEILAKRRGRGTMARAPDCLASHACVPVSNPADPMWGFQ